MKTPSLDSVYLGQAETSCAPAYLDLHVLFKAFNNIARANFAVQPALDSVTNSIIFYYGMDKLYSFNANLDQSRLNLALAVFKWGCKVIGKHEAEFEGSSSLWYKYVLAYMESMIPGGGFDKRHGFLQEWSTSRYDLVWFGKKKRDIMSGLFEELGAGKAPIDGDAREFIDKCASRQISMVDFGRVGPAMAMHFLLAFKAKKKEEEDQARDLQALQMQEYAARLEQVRANMSAHVPSGAVGDDEDFDAPIARFDDEDDEMVIYDPYPVPEGVDLAGVN
jgi:hypothetical protein